MFSNSFALIYQWIHRKARSHSWINMHFSQHEWGKIYAEWCKSQTLRLYYTTVCIFRVRDRERESRPAASVKQKVNEWWKQSDPEPRAAQRGDMNFGWLATFTVKLHRCVVIEMISFSRNVLEKISLWTPRIMQLNCYIFKADSFPSLRFHRGITQWKLHLSLKQYSPQKWKACCLCVVTLFHAITLI